MFSSHCPHCKSIEYRRVGIRNLVEQLFAGILWPCRCELCGRHFLMFRWQLRGTS